MARNATIEDYLKMMLGPRPKQHIAKTAADMLFGGIAQEPPPNASLADQAMHALAQPGVMPIGMTAYHGTPHKFAPTPKNPLGEFDLSKIGTGEGAQSYGHGIYLAEEPAVARDYQLRLSPDKNRSVIESGGRKIDLSRTPSKDLSDDETALAAVAMHNTYSDALQYLKEMSLEPGMPDAGKFANAHRWLADQIAKHGRVDIKHARGGYTYKVDLPDEAVGRMLDWDAPLSQQTPAVRKAIENTDAYQTLLEGYRAGRMKHPDEWKAGDLYYRMTQMDPTRGAPKVSEHLGKHGIPGIRYFDQGSRQAGKGTRNFVVWDTDLLNILGAE